MLFRSAGGYAEGGETPQHPYAVPNDMGLYSHAAVTAANLPQQTMSPDDMRQALKNRHVKDSELKWGEYDYAFGHEPKVNRDEVAKHLWATMPNIEEKVFRKRLPGEPKRHEVRERQYGEEDRFFDEPERQTETPAQRNQARREMRQRHEAELAGLPHGDPYHEQYTLPGGENYREILLKHAGDASFPGVHEHFAGEPDVLASLMMKDRNDTEGKRLAHIEELQSDWAQRGRNNWHELGTNETGVERAPYVEKTEDWMNLGLKRALLEAARGGHDKLSWSPGHIIAERYKVKPDDQWPQEMYDHKISKYLLNIAQKHDPEAALSESVIGEGPKFTHSGEELPERYHTVHSLEITPRMRESILKHGFPAYASGGEVEGYGDGGPAFNPLEDVHGQLNYNSATGANYNISKPVTDDASVSLSAFGRGSVVPDTFALGGNYRLGDANLNASHTFGGGTNYGVNTPLMGGNFNLSANAPHGFVPKGVRASYTKRFAKGGTVRKALMIAKGRKTK